MSKINRFALETNMVGSIIYLNLYTDDEKGIHHKMLSFLSEDDYLFKKQVIIETLSAKGYVQVFE